MNIVRGQIITLAAWIAFAGLVVYVKDRREKAYWKDVADKIVSQMEPAKLPQGEHETEEWGALTGNVVSIGGPVPAGVREVEPRPVGGAGVRSPIQNLKQFLGVSP